MVPFYYLERLFDTLNFSIKSTIGGCFANDSPNHA